MGLAETQRFLAHLYTDSDLRERFAADPDGVGREWGLSPADVQAVTQAPPGQVAFFARSLHAKRLGEVRKLLPLTCRALGPRAGGLFRQYADISVPAGVKKHRADALGFAAFLERLPPSALDAPAWLLDVLRWEAGWQEAADPACRWHVRRTRHAPRPLVHSLTAGEPPAVHIRPTLLVWCRPTRRGPLRHLALPLPFLAGN